MNKQMSFFAYLAMIFYTTSLFALSDPGNLHLTNITEDSITLNWTDNADDETGYKIYRNGTFIYQTEANATTYTDTGLKSGIDW